MEKILIIGGAGYVGTVMTAHLLNAGYQVRTLDKFLYENNHCILPYLGREGYEFVYGDLCDRETLKEALKGITSVVLLAGLVGDPITKKYPEVSKHINERGVIQCVDSLNGMGLEKFIFVSTCSNYGLIKEDKLATEETELRPLSLYAKAKVDAEEHVLGLKGKIDYSPTILRFATAFGLSPRMRFDLTVNEFTRDLAVGKGMLVYDAHTWRPYCHVRDFARLVEMVLRSPNQKTDFEVYNAGGDVNNYTKQGIVDLILEQLPQADVSYQEHGSDPRNYRVDFSKIKETLGFEPEYTIKDGILEILSAINNQTFEHVDKNKNLYGNYEIKYTVM
tara:strand:- start:1133 stop:2134 length:1002 start_codon:yes stop_codon:yes gene_type:complete